MINGGRAFPWHGGTCAVALTGAFSVDRVWTAQQGPSEEGIEVLARGPVHEAFAGTVALAITFCQCLDRPQRMRWPCLSFRSGRLALADQSQEFA
jgi:hypothetical protein